MEVYFDTIERYAEGSMSSDECAQFERQLSEDAALKEAYEVYLTGQEALEQGIENTLRQQLKQWAAEEGPFLTASTSGAVQGADAPKAKRVAMRPVWARWAVAASVVLLAGFLWFRLGDSGTNSANLFATYYQLPDGSAMRSGSGGTDPLATGRQAFAAKDYKTAADFFQNIPASDPYRAEASLLLGHAALQLHEYDRAIAAFSETITLGDVKFTEKAQWNLALTYLAADRAQTPACRALLTALASDPGHSYAQQARKVVAEIYNDSSDF